MTLPDRKGGAQRTGPVNLYDLAPYKLFLQLDKLKINVTLLIILCQEVGLQYSGFGFYFFLKY